MAHGASVAGSCRAAAAQDARELGIDPIVEFDFDPTALSGRFDLVLDTADTLASKAAQRLLKPGGRIIGIHPTAARFAKAALPGPFQVLIARPVTEDLEEVARAAGHGSLRSPIAHTVALTEAIPALTELERNNRPKGGKLIITPE